MSYIKAENVLPRELIETIQQYVDGKLIYIPCKRNRSGAVRPLPRPSFASATKEFMRPTKAEWAYRSLPTVFLCRRKAFRGFSGSRNLP